MRSVSTNDEGYPYKGDNAILKPYLEGGFLSGLTTALGHDYFYELTRPITGGSKGVWKAEDFSAKLFIDTEKEVFGTNTCGNAASEDGLRQTALYATAERAAWRIKKYNGSANSWWLGSPYTTLALPAISAL
jgi:hypothetical protein